MTLDELRLFVIDHSEEIAAAAACPHCASTVRLVADPDGTPVVEVTHSSSSCPSARRQRREAGGQDPFGPTALDLRAGQRTSRHGGLAEKW